MSPSGWTEQLSPDIDTFLREFERRGREPGDEDGTAFHDPFVAADPVGVTVVPRQAFVGSLPLRRAMFERAGVGAARLVSAWQLDLDPFHAIVRTEWDAPRAGGAPSTCDRLSSYVAAKTASRSSLT